MTLGEEMNEAELIFVSPSSGPCAAEENTEERSTPPMLEVGSDWDEGDDDDVADDDDHEG